jgi:hypothetical protein
MVCVTNGIQLMVEGNSYKVLSWIKQRDTFGTGHKYQSLRYVIIDHTPI